MVSPRDSRKWLAAVSAVILAVITGSQGSAQSPPRVLGFERLARTGKADPAELGRLLLGELNCTSCHAADSKHAALIHRKPAPILDTVGSRIQPEYLQRFLTDPQVTKP